MKKIVVLIMLLISLNGTAMAQEVIAEGYGVDKNSALRNAEQNAVAQIVGTYIDTKTLVQDYMVQLQEIYSASRGYVNNVVILSEGPSSDGTYMVKAKMNVESEANTDLMNQLELVMRLNDPRITIIMMRDNMAAGTHDELAESALNDKLINLGFNHIVDADVVANLENARLLERIYNGEKGLVGVGSSYGADYLVLGKTHNNSQNIKLPDYKNGGYKTMAMKVANADITAKIIKLSTGEIIGTFSVTAKGQDVIADNAERNAIRNAAVEAAESLEKKFKHTVMVVKSNDRFRL